jgi:hypothetical protein
MKVTKWSTFSGDFNVSEQNTEHTSGEPGSLSAGPAVSTSADAQGEPAAASMHEASEGKSPDPAPRQGGAAETAGADAPKAEIAKPDAPEPDAPKADTPKADASNADAPRPPGRVMIMSSGDRIGGSDDEARPEPAQGIFGKRRVAALAAVVALAAMAGALGGALATAGLSHFARGDGEVASAGNRALEASVARIDADILALKASVEHTSKVGMSQFNKTSERLDKVEKAQVEPAAKLAKLSDAVDKLRAAPQISPAPTAAAPAAAKEVTGSISPPAAAPAAAPKVEVARLPTVEGWVLRDVANGGALIEGRRGMYEVYAGDPVPGLGRVDAIRRQDGRWVVVTSKGLIVAR